MTQVTPPKVRKSMLQRIFSMDTLILIVGCIMLWYGFTEDQGGMGIFWGVTILIAFVVLQLVRRKDWAKHFAEMEAEQKARSESMARRNDGVTDGKDGSHGQ